MTEIDKKRNKLLLEDLKEIEEQENPKVPYIDPDAVLTAERDKFFTNNFHLRVQTKEGLTTTDPKTFTINHEDGIADLYFTKEQAEKLIEALNEFLYQVEE